MSAKTILQIKNLDISFRTNAGMVHAIRGINLDLQKGETVAIVGESGSGKSVTMKAAAGVPGRGEKIKVKSASNCVFSTRSTVCIASSSVSPGKPMMTSLVSTRSGMTFLA